jgi:hypothetical protein
MPGELLAAATATGILTPLTSHRTPASASGTLVLLGSVPLSN